MKIGILGTGMVGESIGTKLVALGHDVKMGSRSTTNEKAIEWAGKNKLHASHGTFADAAAFGDLVFNCTHGVASIAALELAGANNLNNKLHVSATARLAIGPASPTQIISLLGL